MIRRLFDMKAFHDALTFENQFNVLASLFDSLTRLHDGVNFVVSQYQDRKKRMDMLMLPVNRTAILLSDVCKATPAVPSIY